MDDGAPVAVFKKRNAKTNLRKRPSTPPPESSSSEYSSEDESGQRIKRRRKGGVAAGSTLGSVRQNNDSLSATKFAADRSSTIEVTNDATRQSNWYDEQAPDALDAKNLLGSTRNNPTSTEATNNGTYKGQANYQSFIQKNPNGREGQMGPMKAPTNIRTITVTDYAPDVCKDYKQTGFCGYGDSCKYLHARENYKQGWALDREWEDVQKKKGKKLEGTIMFTANRDSKDNDDDEDAALLEKIPFACIICKQPYKNPIVTQCGHYFCESCAVQRYRKNPNCAACGAGTNGMFNSASKLQKLLDRKKKREERLKESAKDDEDNDD